MSLLVQVAIFLLIVFLVFKAFTAIPSASIYVAAGPLFTRAEQVFFNALVRAVGHEYEVFGKVRVADLVVVKGDRKNKSSLIARNKIAQKHVDFVLVNKKDLSPVCVLELNDRSHLASIRKGRDAFLADVFSKVKLPIVWVTASNAYDPQEIRDSIDQARGYYLKFPTKV